MVDFTESMKAFTDRLKSSIDDRGDSLVRVHQATANLLGGAREFLENVSIEHQARADQVHAFMSDSRANLQETVGAMRDSHREGLAAMSVEMHRTLDAATKSRIEDVNTFMATSHADRCETSKAMRDSHREELAAMREELHQTLDEANRGRLEAVGMMRETFQVARQELAADLGEAAKAWRDFANRRDVAPATKPATKSSAKPMSEPSTEPSTKMAVEMTEPSPEPSTKPAAKMAVEVMTVAPVHVKKPKRADRNHSKRKDSHA